MLQLLTHCDVLTCQPNAVSEIIRDGAILVEGNRIKAVGRRADMGELPGAIERDMGGRTVLPGLMNMHAHMALALPGATGAAAEKETEMETFIRGYKNCQDALNAGITFIRCVGERRGLDFTLRKTFASRTLTGPRIMAAGKAVIISGGHGWSADNCVQADGADEWRKRAREQIRNGADLVKIMITGGIAGEREGIRDSQATFEEMQAAADVAHNAGKHITAHAGSPKAIQEGVRAGLDCVEHGYFMDDETVELMVKHGTWLVPTLCVSRAADYMRNIGVPQWMIDKSIRAGEEHARAYRRALSAGVKIAMGTDMLPGEPNEGTVATYREMEFMHEFGMSTHDVLLSATIHAATLAGEAHNLGTVSAGKLADLIACRASPLDATRNIRTVDFVMKDGDVVRD